MHQSETREISTNSELEFQDRCLMISFTISHYCFDFFACSSNRFYHFVNFRIHLSESGSRAFQVQTLKSWTDTVQLCYERWNEFCPSLMAVRSFTFRVPGEEQSGSFRQLTHVITLGRQVSGRPSTDFLTTVSRGWSARKPGSEPGLAYWLISEHSILQYIAGIYQDWLFNNLMSNMFEVQLFKMSCTYLPQEAWDTL